MLESAAIALMLCRGCGCRAQGCLVCHGIKSQCRRTVTRFVPVLDSRTNVITNSRRYALRNVHLSIHTLATCVSTSSPKKTKHSVALFAIDAPSRGLLMSRLWAAHGKFAIKISSFFVAIFFRSSTSLQLTTC